MSAAPVLVTGGAGFIGSALVDLLVQTGCEVRVLDDLSRGKAENLPAQGCVLIEGDICDPETVHAAVAGVRTVFHLAAVPSVVESVAEPARTHRVNVGGTLNVLDAARAGAAERVVFAGSCAAYGESEHLPLEESVRPQPVSPYALQKVTCEEYGRLYGELYGLEVVGLRFFNVFGPRQDPASEYAAVVPRFAAAAVRGEPLQVFGDGEQTRDFVYVGDVARACHLAAQVPEAAGRIINVASGRQTRLNELVEAMARCTGRKLEVAHLPARAGEVRHSVASLALARRVLGFEPETGLEAGLGFTLGAAEAHIEEPAAQRSGR